MNQKLVAAHWRQRATIDTAQHVEMRKLKDTQQNIAFLINAHARQARSTRQQHWLYMHLLVACACSTYAFATCLAELVTLSYHETCHDQRIFCLSTHRIYQPSRLQQSMKLTSILWSAELDVPELEGHHLTIPSSCLAEIPLLRFACMY